MLRYAKFTVQLVTAAAGAVVAAASDGVITPGEWINVVVVALGAVGVLSASNTARGPWRYTKGYLSGMSTIAALLASFLTGGITLSEIWQLVVFTLGTVGVVSTRNRTHGAST